MLKKEGREEEEMYRKTGRERCRVRGLFRIFRSISCTQSLLIP
jgi:hypothetical protein